MQGILLTIDPKGKQEAENSNILIVEGNPDMENILSEMDKDETLQNAQAPLMRR